MIYNGVFLLRYRLCVKRSQLLIHHCVVPLLPQEKAYIQYPRFRYATSKMEAISVSLCYLKDEVYLGLDMTQIMPFSTTIVVKNIIYRAFSR